MRKDKLIETLRNIGLSDNEAEVYFAALTLGPTPAAKIAALAEVKRSTAYSIIESLEQKGLMNTQVAGFKKKYVAADPNRLEEILEKRKQDFHAVLPEFSALHNLSGGESLIKHYKGWPAVKSIYDDLLLSDIGPGDYYNVFSNSDRWIKLDRDFLTSFRRRRAKLAENGLVVRLILEDDKDGEARLFKKMEKNYFEHVKLLPKDTKLDIDLITTPNRVVFHEVTEPTNAIVIENQSVIDAQHTMFNIMWNALPG